MARVSHVPADARFHSGRGGASLFVHVTAHPSHPTQVSLSDTGVLHIHLQTTRQGAALERRLKAFLAHGLSWPVERIAVAAGEGRPSKIVVMYDLTPAELERRLRKWLQGLSRPPRGRG